MTRNVALTLLAGMALVGCATQNFHVRGGLDRKEWTVQTCDSKETYRVIMTSGQAAAFHQIERQIGPEEPIVLDFTAVDLGPEMILFIPVSRRRVVGIGSPVSIERGTCAATYGKLARLPRLHR